MVLKICLVKQSKCQTVKPLARTAVKENFSPDDESCIDIPGAIFYILYAQLPNNMNHTFSISVARAAAFFMKL